MTPRSPRQTGFTLMEIAIVLAIIGLLLGGLIMPLSVQMESTKMNETRRMLATVNEALIGFALTHGRLPCPAQADIPTGNSSAGIEAADSAGCTCKANSGSDQTVAWQGGTSCEANSVTGVLPWVTLGLEETDAWGRRYTYRVSTEFSDLNSAPLATFTLAAIGAQQVYQNATDAALDVRKVETPVVFLSHGKNGLGGYTPAGTQLDFPTDSEESENSNNNNKFIYHEVSTTFDDLVSWISPNILKSRMVAADKLP